jgi:hypothetical protein
VDGLVGTTEAGETMVEMGCSATDRRTCASDDGEPIPAQ